MNNNTKTILLIKMICLKKYTIFSYILFSCGEVSVGGTGTGVIK